MEAERLTTIQAANLPRLDWRTMVSGEVDKLSTDDVTALNDYFQQFAQVDFQAERSRELGRL